jgi:hypothetical protein
MDFPFCVFGTTPETPFPVNSCHVLVLDCVEFYE